jgi:hypothetical protein
VISIERLLELYQDAEELTQSRGRSSGWREWWERDVRFLRARAEASDEMARRTIALAKGLHRNLAVVTGLAHSAKMQALLRQEPGIRLMVIGFEPGFGEIKQLNLSPAGWWGKQNGSPSKESLDYRLQWVEALRRPAPVVQTTLYQARHELAAISDRLARALYDYAEGRSSNPHSASRSSGRFAYVDASSAQTVRLSASSGATNELAGFLVRAETRFHHTRESLWLAMWRSNYLLPPSEDADGNISAVSVRDFFQRLRRFTQEQYRDRFIEGKIAAREPDDLRDSETNPIRPRVAVLSLGLRACASMVRKRAERCLRGG